MTCASISYFILKMKLITRPNDFSGLKILLASEFLNLPIELEVTPSAEKTVLIVNDDCQLFSCNAAVWYLACLSGQKKVNLQQDKWMDWESTTLYPEIQAFLNKQPQQLIPTLEHLDKATRNKFLIGNSLSAADIVIFCSLIVISDCKFMANCPNVTKWFNNMYTSAQFKIAASKLDIKIKQTEPDQCEEEEAAISLEDIEHAVKHWKTSNINKPKPITHPVLPVEGERNVLITSALPYVNNFPHLGNIIGCVLSADVFARYCRLRNYNTLYICGTDEYGTATETKALEEGLTPQQICDKYFKLHDGVYKWFDISFDHFGRTTTPNQTKIAQDIFLKLYRNNYLTEDTMEQLLCEHCKIFLADRFVEGTCPLCGYEDARGDQCDKCGKLVNAVELKSPRCKMCRHAPVIKTSKHLFLNLPLLEDKLTSWMDSVTSGWTHNARVIANSWVKEGLKPRCITRDLKWGTPVPLEGYTDKVFYVWFDAPIGYLSITACYTEEWERWWKNREQVVHYEFMAKDNVPFHSVVFPSSQLGTHDPYTLVNHLVATEYLNYEDGKFSKSRGVGVFGNNAQETGIPADVWRFYLLYVRPESQDSTFSWSDLMAKNNTELLNNLGNFANRALSFLEKNYGSCVPAMTLGQEEKMLLVRINRELKQYIALLENAKLRDAIKPIFSISRLGNQLMQAAQPWVLIKSTIEEEKAKAGTVIGLCANIICQLSVMLLPYMPNLSAKLQEQLGVGPDINHLIPEFTCRLPAGHRIGKPAPLFQKIEQVQIDELKKRFSGAQVGSASPGNPAVATPAPPLAEASNTLETPENLALKVAQQGDKVRQLKAAKAEKAIVTAAVAELLDLKKRLATAEEVATKQTNDTPAATTEKPTLTNSVENLTKQVTEQGDKVRGLKTTKADKASIDAAVAVLLELKKQLALAEGKDPAESSGNATGKSKKKGQQK